MKTKQTIIIIKLCCDYGMIYATNALDVKCFYRLNIIKTCKKKQP